MLTHEEISAEYQAALDRTSRYIRTPISLAADAPASARLLQQALSIHPAALPPCPTTSEEADNLPPSSALTQIGEGYCGTVFAEANAGLVYKLARTPENTNSRLPHERAMATKVSLALALTECQPHLFAASPLLAPRQPPRVPQYTQTIPWADAAWWATHAPRFPADVDTGAGARDVLQIERVPPLARPTRDALVDAYCPEPGRVAAKLAPGNETCLVRLHLGRRKVGRPAAFFSLRNFPLHVNQARDAGMEVAGYAEEMALGLAVAHWRARVDCNDVEFVLGGPPTALNFCEPSSAMLAEAVRAHRSVDVRVRVRGFKKRRAQLWMIDYDKCRDITMDVAGAEQAARAAEDNDPYFPKPLGEREEDRELWRVFRDAYLEASETVIVEDYARDQARREVVLGLPRVFVGKWEEIRGGRLRARAG